MDGLLWDVILGREFLKQHRSVNFNFGGPECPLHLGVLEPLKANPVRLFEHLTPECQPIAAKSRHYSRADQAFIRTQVCQLLSDDIIEPSSSPWRAQLVIVKNEKHRKRMCVDYSQTVNKFTCLDAYPLPSVINNVTQYKWYSSLDLRSAYHQVPLLPEERKYTAFEANGQLYQFKWIPFGLKNAVPCFQRVINDIITAHGCKGTFAYLDDITVCGRTKEEHDANLKVFLNAAKECNLTLNEGKNQPVERLSLDFKGPLPSSTRNHYTLTVVDEYSRFPFAFPCRSTDAETVISCLNKLFTLFGMPAYVHSDRGPAFVSHDLISYLHQRGIGCSNTSIYNPRGNGQCEP